MFSISSLQMGGNLAHSQPSRQFLRRTRTLMLTSDAKRSHVEIRRLCPCAFGFKASLHAPTSRLRAARPPASTRATSLRGARNSLHIHREASRVTVYCRHHRVARYAIVAQRSLWWTKYHCHACSQRYSSGFRRPASVPTLTARLELAALSGLLARPPAMRDARVHRVSFRLLVVARTGSPLSRYWPL